jgi:hypothetical protein
MKVRTSIAAVGAAALLGTGAFVLPAAASTVGATHKLTFISVTKKMALLSQTAAGQSDWDVNKAGKIVGFDEIYAVLNPKTHTASGDVTVDTDGGFLYGTLALSSSPVTHGKVTGGTGIFKGATGTITGRSLSGTRTAVTITYRG